ncbi:hypothetical protein [Asticcacaulis solisilvae]|uniref:hypothetical protein n=1 Tax=Asticcacaulis solisilvae TaxID=1217274 RepID=UPI003FD8AC83
MFHEIYIFLLQPFWPTINKVATVLICSYAILAGSWRERTVGSVYLIAYLFLESFAVVSHRLPIFLAFLADVLCLPGFLTANRTSPYPWTRWALACQLLSVVVDILNLLDAKYSPPCLIALGVLSYGVLASILAGTISAHARKRRERRSGQINPASGEDGSA